MALRIVPASEPIRVETTVGVLYGVPGIGKTSLAFSARKPILLDTDQGVHRSGFRKDSVTVRSWGDIAGITKEDVASYNTIVLDTSGRALDHLAVEIIAGNAKMGRGGALSLQGYGELKSRFAAYLNLMRSFGLDIVLIAHSDEKQQGDELIERIDMQGGSKQEVYKSADWMARLSIKDGKRVLNFSPTETAFGKDPAGIGAVEVPHLSQAPNFLGDLIDQIKTRLNEQAGTRQAEATKATEWVEKLAAATTPETLTALIGEAGSDKRRKKSILDAAADRGFEYDKELAAFVEPAGTPF